MSYKFSLVGNPYFYQDKEFEFRNISAMRGAYQKGLDGPQDSSATKWRQPI